MERVLHGWPVRYLPRHFTRKIALASAPYFTRSRAFRPKSHPTSHLPPSSNTINHNHHYDRPPQSTMSSPAKRSTRNSQSATPRRSARNSQPVGSSPAPDPAAAQLLGEAASSQPGSQRGATPRKGRQVPESSPLFYSNSPAAGPSNAARDASSPLRQMSNTQTNEDAGDRTPRASGNGLIGG